MSTEPEAQEAAEVMARYCRGDAAAFHRLYALLAARILAYLHRPAGRPGRGGGHAAAHLPQGARGALDLRAAAPIRSRGSTPSRTARALDEIRKRKRSRVRLSKDGEAAAAEPAAHITGVAADVHPDPADRPDPSAAAGRARRARQAARQPAPGVDPDQGPRPVVADAAMITGSTPGAIKQRAHRAYVTLRQMLGRKEVA